MEARRAVVSHVRDLPGKPVNVLQSPGEALLPLRTPGTPGNADEEIKDQSGIPYPNAIHIPVVWIEHHERAFRYWLNVCAYRTRTTEA